MSVVFRSLFIIFPDGLVWRIVTGFATCSSTPSAGFGSKLFLNRKLRRQIKIGQGAAVWVGTVRLRRPRRAVAAQLIGGSSPQVASPSAPVAATLPPANARADPANS